jgi:ornithine carbamoyltransferase
MADLMTIEEKKGKLAGLKITWLGDYNNVAKTFAQAAPMFGFDLTISLPPELKNNAPAGVKIVLDPAQAVQDADVVVTDTWVSMGQEGKTTGIFLPYQVNAVLMACAKPDAIFMHCLPAHRGEEVTDDIIDGPQSVVFDEAENRLHAQKAVLAWCLENAGVRVKPIGL